MTDPNLQTIDTTIPKWTAIAADVEESPSTVPLLVLLGEAMDLAGTVAAHWEPVDGKNPVPGLKAAIDPDVFPETAATDLRELAGAVSQIHGEYRAVTGSTLSAPVERGEFLLSEMRQCLEHVLDDGRHEQDAGNLARLTESHSDTSSHDALALSLEGFAFFGNKHRDLLANLPEFDLTMLDEAIAVANRLREQSAIRLSGVQADRQRTFLALRNRLITVLTNRMNGARRMIRFVFRNHPDISQKASSIYQRDRRAAARIAARAAAEAAAEAAEGAAAVTAAVAPATPVAPSPLTTSSLDMEGAMGSPFTA